MKNINVYLKTLRVRAWSLANAAESLPILLEQEASQLQRGDQVQQLYRLCRRIAGDLEIVRQEEDRARSGETFATSFDYVTGLATSLIAKGLDNNLLRVMSDHLIAAPTHPRLTYDNVFVAIGPKGLPDDVEVVSVSRLARESQRPESDVIKELRSAGNLLFTERLFTLLVDTLSSRILKGEISLPVPADRLPGPIPSQIK